MFIYDLQGIHHQFNVADIYIQGSMEAGMNLLSSSPSFLPKNHLRNSPYSSYSIPSSSTVLMLHEQPTPAVISVPTNSIARQFPTSVLLQEQRDEHRPFLHITKEDRTSQATLDGRQMEAAALVHEEENSSDSDRYLKEFNRQLLHWPGVAYLLPSLQAGDNLSSSLTMQSNTSNTGKLMDVKACDVISLAKKALLASREAAALAENSRLFNADIDESLSPVLGPTGSTSFPLQEQKTVRSKRLLERQLKRRRMPKSSVMIDESNSFRRTDVKRKSSEAFDPNDPLRLFLWGPETKKLLTAAEESILIVQIQNLMKLEEVKNRLQSQSNREPTLVEWAEAVGLSCRVLQMQLRLGKSSREKLIYANLRMVVHIAKQYQGRGLNLQDLLQDGSMGLMKSVEKFKPQAGCRFATYAYWWIRQSIRRAVFQHSRTIRLPDNVYTILGKVMEAKKVLIQEEHRQPTKEELAQRVGISVEKLEGLLFSARYPLSIQQPVWTDQDTTFQEITADTHVEIPDVSVGKQLMRQHVRNLLGILSPRERRIIRLRFGIEGGKQQSLSEIGTLFGLSKERVRQLESRAFYKLKQCLDEHGLEAYADLLV